VWHLRILGLLNIRLSNSGRTTPVVTLFGIWKSYPVSNLLRMQVEEKRTQKDVREMDL